MNTADLQLECLYVAVASMINAIRDKGLLTEQEIEGAEDIAPRDRASQLSGSHRWYLLSPSATQVGQQGWRTGAAALIL